MEFILGPAIMRRLDAFQSALFYERHPLMQGFYLLLVTGPVGLFAVYGWHKTPNANVTVLD
ncbi:hypothetical protein HDU98_001735, partial [Podochytrium sp. JEL0797]